MSKERYDILKLLGKGRTGGVYEAEDSRLGRKVAMRRFFSENDQTDVSVYEDEFIEIAQSLSALQHPNLLRVFDAGMDEDGAFIISQLMKGDSLHNRLKEGPLSDWDVWDLGHQMLDALSTAHAGGFSHGAITPGSILMSPRARGGYLYVILDMGLSHLAPLIQGQDSVLSMMADPAILAPELFDGSEATEKADLYMLGNILYMCLAGGHPFAEKPLKKCAELHSEGLPDLKEFAPDTPQNLLDWIGGLCEVKPEDRPSSVVVALKSMPKVVKPAKVGITPIHTTSVVTTIAPATNLTAHLTAEQSTYGNPAPDMTATDPLMAEVAGAATGIIPQTSHVQLLNEYQTPRKPYKILIVTIACVALLGIGLFVIMGGSGKKTGEEIAAEKAKKEQERKVKDNTDSDPKPVQADSNNTFPLEEAITFKVVGGEPNTQAWNVSQPKRQRLKPAGWIINGAKEQNPGISKLISPTDIEDIYKRGWNIKYDVKALRSEHTMGMLISSDLNEYWGDKNKPVRLLLKLAKVDDKLIITSLGVSDKVEVDVGEDFLTIELRGGAMDPKGSYKLFLNDKVVEGFVGQLNQAPIKANLFENKLFSFSGSRRLDTNRWQIRELTLSTGTPAEE